MSVYHVMSIWGIFSNIYLSGVVLALSHAIFTLAHIYEFPVKIITTTSDNGWTGMKAPHRTNYEWNKQIRRATITCLFVATDRGGVLWWNGHCFCWRLHWSDSLAHIKTRATYFWLTISFSHYSTSISSLSSHLLSVWTLFRKHSTVL